MLKSLAFVNLKWVLLLLISHLQITRACQFLSLEFPSFVAKICILVKIFQITLSMSPTVLVIGHNLRFKIFRCRSISQR
nr:MAG TPA: hypothetical protein [Caudoviricetes sp.]